MAYTKVFNYLSTLMRGSERQGLILPPFSKNVTIQPGYYSKCIENLTIGEVEENDKQDKDYFQLKDINYRKREEVLYTVGCSIGAFTNFIESMNFSKPEINGAELHAVCERATNALWINISNRVTEADHQAILNSQRFVVDGQNPLTDIYGGIYSIIYYLMYYVVAENRCEPTDALAVIKTNIENLDKYWGGHSKKENQIRELIGGAIDVFVNKYIAPYLTIEATKVGQAHINENLSSIMAEYKDLKNKVYYIMGGQVDKPKYFMILDDYVNMVLGQEDSFYDLLGLIIAENLHGDDVASKLQERLTVDDDQLENSLKRLIAINLSYINSNEESMNTIRRITSKAPATVGSEIEESLKIFMAQQLERIENGFNRTQEYEAKLPVAKVINTRSTTYTLTMGPDYPRQERFKEVIQWAVEIKDYLERLLQAGITKKVEEEKNSVKVTTLSLHHYDKIKLVLTPGPTPNMPPHITIIYEKANMSNVRTTKLKWSSRG